MITICKFTISSFRQAIPKFSKINFAMAVDRNAVIKLHKSRKSNVEIGKRLDMDRLTAWKIVKKFQENEHTLNQPGRGRKRSVRSPQLLKNKRAKLRRNPRRSYRTLPTAAGVSKSTMHQALRDDLGVKPFKMLHRQELTANHVDVMTQKCRKILQEDDGTLSNLVFTDEKKFDIQHVVSQQNKRVWASSLSTEERIVTRRQNQQSVMVWAAVTETGRSPLLFVPSGVKLKFQRYIAHMLEGCLLPWAKKHFQGGSLVPATGLCSLLRFQDHPALDSEENPLIHKQGSLLCKEP